MPGRLLSPDWALVPSRRWVAASERERRGLEAACEPFPAWQLEEAGTGALGERSEQTAPSCFCRLWWLRAERGERDDNQQGGAEKGLWRKRVRAGNRFAFLKWCLYEQPVCRDLLVGWNFRLGELRPG